MDPNTNLPRSIRIADCDYILIGTESTTDITPGKDLLAEIKNNTLEIKIAKKSNGEDIPWQALKRTIWHEIVHAICQNNSIEISEAATEIMAMNICQILRDNEGIK